MSFTWVTPPFFLSLSLGLSFLAACLVQFITDGGTVWTDSSNGVANAEGAPAFDGHNDGQQSTVGQFLYLEGQEYLMYNTCTWNLLVPGMPLPIRFCVSL